MTMKSKTKKVFGLRIRFDERESWGPWTWYDTRRERDKDERTSRIIGGLRTHTCESRKGEDTP